VLDAYCGSGTALVAAERSGRAWVGIDQAPQAIALTLERLKAAFGTEVAERIAICHKNKLSGVVNIVKGA
jgi:DNA modification methylase